MPTGQRRKEPRVKATGGGKTTSEDRGRAFVLAYLSNGHNATQAAISAGYSAKSAAQKGSDLLHRPDVVAILEEERERIAKKSRATVDDILQEFESLAMGATRDAVKIRALEGLAKIHGMFVEKVEQKNTFTDADGNPTLPTVKVVFVNPSKETPSADHV